MNLAEIRKKTETAKKAVPLAETAAVDKAALGNTSLEAFDDISASADTVDEGQPSPLLEAEVLAGCNNSGNPSDPERVVFLPSPTEVCDLFDDSLDAPPSDATDLLDSGLHGSVQPAGEKALPFGVLDAILAGRAVLGDESADTIGADLTESTGVEDYLCFKVADEEYAISIMAIKEIIKPREMTEVPRVPDFIPGIISLRGLIIPVMDMRRRLSHAPGGHTGKERIIVLRRDSGYCGILVDAVVQVARINRADIEDPPAALDGIDREFVKGLGHFDGRMIILLSLETILNMNID